jgi:NAD(P)-dependent dehydrogenase (short-subunit alcohol dehydrogenase family)
MNLLSLSMSKNTIIVVGASRGIGKALVELLAQNPEHQVYALSRNVQVMDEQF